MSEEERQPLQVAIGDYIAQAFGDGAKAVVNVFKGGIEEARELRNRQGLIDEIKKTWVNGVLEHSLNNDVLIELDIQMAPEMIINHNPYKVESQRVDQKIDQLTSGTGIYNIFEETDQRLLILGEPGSGKTTMLLELARQAIIRAEEEPTERIPVYFNLSTWGETDKPLSDWLEDEFNDFYNIKRKVSKNWIDNDDLIFMLDGLDEVRKEKQITCVGAINSFIESQKPRIAVCSRIKDYEALGKHLYLNSAIKLLPLNIQQIDQYLARNGIDPTTLRSFLQMNKNEAFRELVQTPLMLNIFTTASMDNSRFEPTGFDTVKNGRTHLLNAYVAEMFQRAVSIPDMKVGGNTIDISTRKSKKYFSDEETKSWLAWVGQKMMQNNESSFLIEKMQPSWLGEKSAEKEILSKSARVVGLVCGLVGLLIFGLFGGLISGLVLGFVSGIGGLFLGIIIGGLTNPIIKPNEILKWSWKNAVVGVLGGLIGLLVFGLVFALLSVWTSGPVIFFVCILVGGLVVLQIIDLASEFLSRNIKPQEVLKWSWKNAVVGLVGGLVGLVFYVVEGLQVGFVVGGLVGGLIIGLKDSNFKPKAVLRWSWYNATVGLAGWLVGWLLLLLISVLVGDELIIVVVGLPVFLLVVMLVVGLTSQNVKLKELLISSWKNTTKKGEKGLPIRGSIVWVFGLILVSIISGQIISEPGEIVLPVVVLLVIMAIMVGIGNVDLSERNIPNQGIWQSGKNAVFVGLLAGLIAGLIVGILVGSVVTPIIDEIIEIEMPDGSIVTTKSDGLFLGLSYELLFVLSIGLLVGFFVGLIFGGMAFVQHFTLRYLLWRRGHIPFRLIPFLDYCVDRIFLYKVGGGYIFIHGQLLEHFAEMELDAEF